MSEVRRLVKAHVVGQLVALAALAFVAANGWLPGGPQQSFAALLGGWALFASNALLMALAAIRLMRQAGEGDGAVSLGARLVFLGLKAVWLAVGVYLGLVVARLPGGLFVAGAATGLAAFAASSFGLARQPPVSEKS